MDHPQKSVHFLRTEKRSSSCSSSSPITAPLPEHCIIVHCRISKDVWDRKEKKRKIRKSSSRREKGRRVQSNKMKERVRNKNVTQFRFLFRSYAFAKKKKKTLAWILAAVFLSSAQGKFQLGLFPREHLWRAKSYMVMWSKESQFTNTLPQSKSWPLSANKWITSLLKALPSPLQNNYSLKSRLICHIFISFLPFCALKVIWDCI